MYSGKNEEFEPTVFFLTNKKAHIKEVAFHF